MTPRPRATLAAAALALAAPALAQDPATDGSAAPPRADRAPGGVDHRARVRSIPGGLALEVDGTTVELRFTDGAPARSGPAPAGEHELRATVTVDGRERGVVIRVVPPPTRTEDL
jgi:hypothetical protein